MEIFGVTTGKIDVPIVALSLITVISGFCKYYKNQPIGTWSYKRIYFLFTYTLLGLSLCLLGTTNAIDDITRFAEVSTGIALLFMIFAPCGLEIFNEYRTLKIIRGVFFGFISFIFILPPP